jgi:hypothetical protein
MLQSIRASSSDPQAASTSSSSSSLAAALKVAPLAQTTTTTTHGQRKAGGEGPSSPAAQIALLRSYVTDVSSPIWDAHLWPYLSMLDPAEPINADTISESPPPDDGDEQGAAAEQSAVNSLRAGAVAGIIIACFGTLLAIMLIIYLCRRRDDVRRTHNKNKQDDAARFMDVDAEAGQTEMARARRRAHEQFDLHPLPAAVLAPTARRPATVMAQQRNVDAHDEHVLRSPSALGDAAHMEETLREVSLRELDERDAVASSRERGKGGGGAGTAGRGGLAGALGGALGLHHGGGGGHHPDDKVVEDHDHDHDDDGAEEDDRALWASLSPSSRAAEKEKRKQMPQVLRSEKKALSPPSRTRELAPAAKTTKTHVIATDFPRGHGGGGGGSSSDDEGSDDGVDDEEHRAARAAVAAAAARTGV